MPSSESDDDGVELSGAALAALQLHFQEAAQPNSVGGAIHLAAVERNDTYRELFFEEEDDGDRRAAAERIGLRLLHAEPNIYEWRGFLPDADVAFLRELGVTAPVEALVERPSLLGLETGKMRQIVDYLRSVDTPADQVMDYITKSI